MAVRGAEEKLQIIEKMQEVFPEMFECDKVWRIPVGDVEIKVALTCAKDVVRGAATPSAEVAPEQAPAPTLVEPSAQELDNVATLMNALNF